jgi:phosphoribosylamine-glycine ligase
MKSPYCFIIKPVDNSGSRGVRRVETLAEFQLAFDDAKKFSRSKKVIAEEWIAGNEYTVELFLVNGKVSLLGFSKKTHIPHPYCVSICLEYYPYKLDPFGEAIVNEAIKATKAVGLKNGPAHIEIIYSSLGPMLVEIAARGGGFKIFSEILPSISGVNQTSAVIDLSLGTFPSVEPLYEYSSILKFFNPVGSGKIQSVDGIECARKVKNIFEVMLNDDAFRKNYQGIRSDGDRLGYIIAVSKDFGDASKAVQKAEELIKFKFG